MTGELYELTALIRSVCEFFAFQNEHWMPAQIEEHLQRLVPNWADYRRHCFDSMKEFRKSK